VHNIYCLISRGNHVINDHGRELLHRFAMKMHGETRKRIKLETNDALVDIRTKFDTGMLGSMVGIKFTAHIELKDGGATQEIEYIVRVSELPDPEVPHISMWIPVSEGIEMFERRNN
jgi:hypothetical protein